MDITQILKGIVFKFCIIFLTICTLLWFSVFSYVIMYYVYIPSVAHVKPVYLQYDMFCNKGSNCKYPFANITLLEEGQNEFLRGGQGYAIELVLEMPESERNIHQGMFMIMLNMLSENGRIIQSSHRPAILHYRSPLFKILYTLFFIPGLLAGSVQEKQTLIIPLFEHFFEDSNNPSYFAYIEIQAKAAELYSSILRIHAQFTGLRYAMYYWPVTSSIVGVGSIFLFLAVTIFLIWLREIMKPPNDVQNAWYRDTEQESVKPKAKKEPQKISGIRRDITPDMFKDTLQGDKYEEQGKKKSESSAHFKSCVQRIDDDIEEDIDASNLSKPSSSDIPPTLRHRTYFTDESD